MDQIRLEMDQKELKIPKIPFFVEILSAEHMLLEEIILSKESLGGSPTISGTLVPAETNLHKRS